MTETLFWLNVVVATWVFLISLRRKSGYLEVPTLVSVVYLVWYLPQCWFLLNDASITPSGSTRLLLMSLLCLVGTYAGWQFGVNGPHTFWDRAPKVDLLRLQILGMSVSAFALLMYLLIGLQPVEVRLSTQWTGPITILSMLSSVGVVGLALATAMVFRKLSIVSLASLILALIVYFPLVFILFRRAGTFELVLTTLMAAWRFRKLSVPRPLFIIGVVLSFFFIHGVGKLRDLGHGYRLDQNGAIAERAPSLSEIASIDWFSAADIGSNARNSEAMNAAKYLEVITRKNELTYGAELWNGLVFAYVPGQLVGYDRKSSLMIGAPLDPAAAAEQLGYRVAVGTTTTGFVQAYRDFGYVGASVFLLMGWVMGKFYRKSSGGDVLGYLLYSCLLSLTLLSVTHFSYFFFVHSILLVSVIYLITHFSKLSRLPLSRVKPELLPLPVRPISRKFPF